MTDFKKSCPQNRHYVPQQGHFLSLSCFKRSNVIKTSLFPTLFSHFLFHFSSMNSKIMESCYSKQKRRFPHGLSFP
nr:MAG TPA: hypothetical protein [Caudoviricetes sp.]